MTRSSVACCIFVVLLLAPMISSSKEEDERCRMRMDLEYPGTCGMRT
ncbi:hypothetical protein COLO4_19080 [Corchorus olitorius]|uniref:Uncharacterized protein n=1 Tax=Corchorus olitorius TaxID=93759 RepID=A0A1R3J6P3_9ROSI|nr:hypothetical protein COLO4_19080 [Corchorus olitorius]